jgi:D-glycerate 3-kinase
LDWQPRIVILEGWFIGSPPQLSQALKDPANEFEERQDADGEWRSRVNQLLARHHLDLAHRLDSRWFLAAPDWSSVIDWRWQQELEDNTEGRLRHLQSRQAVTRFLAPFQRIAMHMLSGCERWADQIVQIDNQHMMSLR